MLVAGGGFDQCYNAQAGVDTEMMLVTNAYLGAAINDKQQITSRLERLPEALGKLIQWLADTGYFSRANVEASLQGGIEPLLAIKRESYHGSVLERFAPDRPLPQSAGPVEGMAHRLTTHAGRARYASEPSSRYSSSKR